MNVHLIFVMFALVFFVVSTWGAPVAPYWNRLVSAGLACLAASMLPW